MAKVSAGDIRNGVTIEVDGKVCQVIDFMHVKPGKGAAFVRVKMKNIIDGGVVETTFRPTETFEQAHIERKKMQYLYNDGEFYNYMDNETFEQIMISAEDAADSMKFVKENEEVTISFYQGNAFAIDPPLSVELVVTETEPGVKGNTATGATKPLRRALRLTFHCSLIRARQSRLIPVQEHIFQEHKICFMIFIKSLAFFAGLFYNLNTIIFLK